MLKIYKEDNALVVEGLDNGQYPDNGQLSFPLNSISVVIDESDMATFRSASNNDVVFSGLIENITINGESVTKDNIIEKFDAISNSAASGGGGGMTPEERQELKQLRSDVEDVMGEVATLEADKQNKLTPGENITIVDNVISATGGGGGSVIPTVKIGQINNPVNGMQSSFNLLKLPSNFGPQGQAMYFQPVNRLNTSSWGEMVYLEDSVGNKVLIKKGFDSNGNTVWSGIFDGCTNPDNYDITGQLVPFTIVYNENFGEFHIRPAIRHYGSDKFNPSEIFGLTETEAKSVQDLIKGGGGGSGEDIPVINLSSVKLSLSQDYNYIDKNNQWDVYYVNSNLSLTSDQKTKLADGKCILRIQDGNGKQLDVLMTVPLGNTLSGFSNLKTYSKFYGEVLVSGQRNVFLNIYDYSSSYVRLMALVPKYNYATRPKEWIISQMSNSTGGMFKWSNPYSWGEIKSDETYGSYYLGYAQDNNYTDIDFTNIQIGDEIWDMNRNGCVKITSFQWGEDQMEYPYHQYYYGIFSIQSQYSDFNGETNENAMLNFAIRIVIDTKYPNIIRFLPMYPVTGDTYDYNMDSMRMVSSSLANKLKQLPAANKVVNSDNLKTINGQSLVGSGDIEISGGASLPAGNYLATFQQSGGSIIFAQRGFDGKSSTEKTVDFKTINGQSIFGQGDLKIEGGGSSAKVWQLDVEFPSDFTGGSYSMASLHRMIGLDISSTPIDIEQVKIGDIVRDSIGREFIISICRKENYSNSSSLRYFGYFTIPGTTSSNLKNTQLEVELYSNNRLIFTEDNIYITSNSEINSRFVKINSGDASSLSQLKELLKYYLKPSALTDSILSSSYYGNDCFGIATSVTGYQEETANGGYDAWANAIYFNENEVYEFISASSDVQLCKYGESGNTEQNQASNGDLTMKLENLVDTWEDVKIKVNGVTYEKNQTFTLKPGDKFEIIGMLNICIYTGTLKYLAPGSKNVNNVYDRFNVIYKNKRYAIRTSANEWEGTFEEYKALGSYSDDVTYYITED